MDKIVIKGGQSLHGEISVSGAKNATLPILAASLLTSEKIVVKNIPNLRDVITISRLLTYLGAEVYHDSIGGMNVDASTINKSDAPYELVKTMRASCLVLGPLLARHGQVKVSLPGGCAIGERPMNLHIKALEAMGAKITLEHGYIIAEAKKLKGNRIYFDISTVTGTENIMMAATLAEGETIIENAAAEPEVVCLADMLRKMGAVISGDGSDTITIKGVASLKGATHDIIPDRIEAGTFMIAAAITKGDLKINNCIPEHLESLIMKMREAGITVESGQDYVRVKTDLNIRGVDISTAPYPGFPTDMQAQFMALMTISKGMSVITETVFENRFMHVAEMKRMGAKIQIRGKSSFIKGIKKLSGAQLMATDLRASASLILAALAAEGESVISRVYHLDRGYEKIEEKLFKVGANIRRVTKWTK